MTTFIVDDESSQTPIGAFLAAASDSLIEIRSTEGELLARVFVPSQASDEDARYEKLFELAEQNRQTIERRMKTPVSECLTTEEVLERLHQTEPR